MDTWTNEWAEEFIGNEQIMKFFNDRKRYLQHNGNFLSWPIKNGLFDTINHKLIMKYSRLPLSRIPRDSLKHFEISVLRHIRVERVRKTIN